MKRIGLTQRVDVISNYGEVRDALDQQWYSLLLDMNMLPVPLPNISPEYVEKLAEELQLDGIVFTGGNSLCHLDDKGNVRAPERDVFELALIEYTQKRDLPIFGVCRGMQIINHYFGGVLRPVEGHIAVNHEITSLTKEIELPIRVNSFHGWTIPSTGLGQNLKPVAQDINGNIEGFIHETKRVAGIAWHPERAVPFDVRDLKFMKRILL
ncbi:gamma-glutamyl-gamma-aminobutyrate hydrolase family protein [Vibrio vulnificus]|uniref:gamma-glutamyl-gamma-aminobutyrate hydrolase family protein n=1 Tax=Vibrio vulnificus TaxID=672 RepID=UPI001CDD45F2|nr:gamma-glutamyl-gamma-aminobutyrate hydrolase family protein [Vibrio vulnificus]MCA4021088.1 gamma-glutamyl-gamma-aminobutyrate hydrolase family protein [Vibrio vulnificus]